MEARIAYLEPLLEKREKEIEEVNEELGQFKTKYYNFLEESSIKDELIEELENKKNSLEDLVSSKEEMILEI